MAALGTRLNQRIQRNDIEAAKESDHHEIEEKLVELEKADMSSSGWLNQFKSLKDTYLDHIGEEEKTIFPDALKVVERVQQWGSAVILSDGDVVFQPLKISRSGLANAVSGRVLIYVHKEQELDDLEQRYPAEHYVLVDDKLRILAAVKKFWASRVTTVFVRQGHYAADPKVLARYPPSDISIGRIGDLLHYHLPELLKSKP